MSAPPDPATLSLEPAPAGHATADAGRGPVAPVARPGAALAGPARAWLAPPQLPPWPIVWLACENGPGSGAGDRTVLAWGLAVDDGRREPRLEAIAAGFGDHGARRAWERFTARANEVVERHPDARWVHFSPAERASVRACAATAGAPAGLLERLEEALFELRSRGVRRALGPPLDSGSIRRVAAVAGYRWRTPPAGPGGFASRYRQARASTDPAQRARVLREIADSNAEGLQAMRAVWRWMLEQGPREHCG